MVLQIVCLISNRINMAVKGFIQDGSMENFVKHESVLKAWDFFFKLTNSEGADSFCNIILQECKCKSEYLMVYQVTAKHSCMQLKFERKKKMNLHA